MTCDIQQMLYKSVIANVIDYFDIQINQRFPWRITASQISTEKSFIDLTFLNYFILNCFLAYKTVHST